MVDLGLVYFVDSADLAYPEDLAYFVGPVDAGYSE